jgi:hypothetical protein
MKTITNTRKQIIETIPFKLAKNSMLQNISNNRDERQNNEPGNLINPIKVTYIHI